MLLQRLGIRKLEAFIVGLIFIIGVSFFIQIFVANPNAGEIASGLVPHLENSTALYIAIGIIGATVMPHNLYLHSALVQTRKFNTDDKGIRKALKMNFIDSAVALNMALLVNAAILILAATVFYKTGRTDVAEIKQAYELLPQHLGSTFAAHLFAIALIAAGQSSTITGTLAGQIVMEGYLRLRINPIVRRLITRLIAIVPAVLVIIFYGEEDVDNLLIFSQVILSMQLGFAIIPLIHFVSDKKTMGKFAIKFYVKISAWLIAIVLVYLNLRMIIEESDIFFESSGNLIWKIFVVIAGILFIIFLGYTTYYPLSKTRKKAMISHLHNEPTLLKIKPLPEYKKIAIALDFSEMDQPLFNQALSQGSKKTKFVLIHIVESVSANVYNEESTDNETQTDRTFLQHYSDQLKELGYNAEAKLGFGKTAREIARIVNETQSELLVIGAHGHRGFSDFIYGETINNVRHRIKVPVLVVNKPRV
jgi:manganese transport protein